MTFDSTARYADLTDLKILAQSANLTIFEGDTPTAHASLLTYIRTQFQNHFGAAIADDTPNLFGCINNQGELVGAWGLRDKESGFFSQVYVAEDLCSSLSRCLKQPVHADQLIELSHLSIENLRVMSELTPLLAHTLQQLGYLHVVCTATQCMQRLLVRKGLAPCWVADAEFAALPATKASRWGNYYEHHPRVLAGGLLEACSQLPNTQIS